MQGRDKPIILVIIHTSLGELQWILPFLNYIGIHRPTHTIVAVFFNGQVLAKARADKRHFDLLQKYSVVLEKKDLFLFLVRHAGSVEYIFKDFWPIHKKSLAYHVRRVCRKAKLILFPHTCALYSIHDTLSPYAEDPAKHQEGTYDYLILNSGYDREYWSRRIQHEKIRVVGPLVYSDWWLSHYLHQESELKNRVAVIRKRFKNVVLFCLRPADNAYIMEKDHHYLFHSALQELMALPDVFVFVKPHPRQDKKVLEKDLSLYPPDRVVVTYENSFVVASLVDLCVNYWTSVTTDSLAVHTPTLEYFIYNTESTQWGKDGSGKTRSFYYLMGLTEHAEDQEEFRSRFRDMLANRERYRDRQYERFHEVFGDAGKSGEKLLSLLNEIRREGTVVARPFPETLLSFFRISLSSLRSFLSNNKN